MENCLMAYITRPTRGSWGFKLSTRGKLSDSTSATAPPSTRSDSLSHCRSYSVAFDCGIAEWRLQLCQSLVQSIIHQPEVGSFQVQVRVWIDAPGALHLSIVTAGLGERELGDERTAWSPLGTHFRGKSLANCRWLVDCAIHHHQNFDESALVDVLLTMGEMNELGSSGKVTPYHRLCDGIRQISPTSRRCLASSPFCKEGFRGSGRGSHFTHTALKFSDALKATVSADTSLARDISNDEARAEMTAKQYLRYSQILFSLADNDSWAHQLRSDGHLDICLTIANAIELLKISPLKEQLALYTSLLNHAWCFAALLSNVAPSHPDYQFGDILEPLAEATMTHFEQE
ncbi:hypothetical protein BU15DRAFT_59212 [Melanogaster broomeanus]|nr:hypothetical protein BU15DRAFT_59212 [Melanogaster broomeanus]